MTGHDPDFHAFMQGDNSAGAQTINRAAIGFVTDPAFNSFAAGGVSKFLFVESSMSPPVGHVDGEGGIVASGYTPGVNFDRVDASGLNAALDALGTTYDAIVVGSDYGGILSQAELDILDAHSSAIINFLNAGGGLYAMAEGDSGANLTPNGGFFDYLPFIVTSAQLNEGEVGNTVTAFGASIGLTNNDVNGNASHNIFDGASGLNIVDLDASGHILSLATRSQVSTGGLVPEPGTILLCAASLAALLWRSKLGSYAKSN